MSAGSENWDLDELLLSSEEEKRLIDGHRKAISLRKDISAEDRSKRYSDDMPVLAYANDLTYENSERRE